MKPRLLALLALSFAPLALRAAAAELYISAGQSNMVGLGAKAEPRHLEPHPRISVFTTLPGGKEPVWTPTQGTAPKDLGRGGIGPWWSFAHVLAATKPEAEIRILALAQSGTALKKWIKGGEFYDGNLAAVRAALADGHVLKGFIWHQGEAGTGIPDAKYEDLFAQMIADYRVDLGQGDFPVVAGTIGTGKGGRVNDALVQLVGKLPAYAVAITDNRTLSDNVHYDAPTAEALGVEMAKQMLLLQKGPAPVALTPPPAPVYRAPAGARELLATADSSTNARSAKHALGAAPLLYVQGSPNTRGAYLWFPAVPADAKKLSLVVHARAVPAASARLAVRPLAPAAIDENALNGENAPPFAGEAAAESTVSVASGFVSIDLAALLATARQRAFGVALVSLDEKAHAPLVLDSREGAFAPRLIVE